MAKIVVIGAGAMGSVYAGLMQDAGHEVHGVSLWENHVAAVNENGLRVYGASGDRNTRLASFSTRVDAQKLSNPDLLIISTKAFDVEPAANSAQKIIGDQTVVQSIQNGLGSPERVASIVDPDCLSVGVVGGFGASVHKPGVVHHNGMELIRFSSFKSLSRKKMESAAYVWNSSGFEVKIFEDTDQMVWEKLIMNVAFSGTTSMTEMTIGQVMSNESSWSVACRCAKEAIEVAEARSIRLDVGDPIEHIKSLGSKIPDARPSMLLDYIHGRRCEVDVINGGVVEEGKKVSVPTPTNSTVSNLIRAREMTYLHT